MSQVLVWKSDQDGKLFEDKAKYTKHLRGLAAQRGHARKIVKMEAEREAFILRMGQTVTSIKELEEFVTDNWEWFFANGMKHKLWHSDKTPKNKHKLVSIKFDMHWNDSVSNTHTCPRGGVQNWDRSRNREKGLGLPEGYPGWSGQLRFVVDAGMSAHKKNPYQYNGYGSDYFRDTIINTGGGGGGGSNYSYDMSLFASDFPAMAEMRNKMKVWSVLNDGNVDREFA